MTPSSNQLEQVSNYHSFLVRLWREQPNAPWRASVQYVQTGAVIHFTDLTRLFAFLQAQTVNNEQAAVHELLPLAAPSQET